MTCCLPGFSPHYHFEPPEDPRDEVARLACLSLSMMLKLSLELWRRGGLVVSASDFRSEGRWFELSLCHLVVSLDKKLYSTLSLFTQVYKWVLAIIMLWGNLAMD